MDGAGVISLGSSLFMARKAATEAIASLFLVFVELVAIGQISYEKNHMIAVSSLLERLASR